MNFNYFISKKEVRNYTNDLLNLRRTFMADKFYNFNDSDLGKDYAYTAKSIKAIALGDDYVYDPGVTYAASIDYAGSGEIRIIWKGENSPFRDFVFIFKEIGNDVWHLKIADHY